MTFSDEYALFFDNVTYSYGREPVLENVNLKIRFGDFASIVGPNGGGKTTMLKLILGLLKPDSGRVYVLGKNPKKSRLRMGYMPQYAHLDIDFPVTVMDVVLMGRLGLNSRFRYSKEDIKAAGSALCQVNISDMSNRMFSRLSGGQRQRVLIARALCSDPDILLLDEPTANIDPEIEETIFSLLVELNKKMTILVVTHDLGFVSQVVKSVICVNRRVLVHPTSEINGALVKDIYGADLRMVRHDHRCSEKGHIYD